MTELSKLLETRCIDVFELTPNSSYQNKEAILARGKICYYFSKIHSFISKVFITGYELDWNYVEKETFLNTFSYVKEDYYKLRIEGMDGVRYYFHLANKIWNYLTDYRMFEVTSPFKNIPEDMMMAMPGLLFGARLFRGTDMTMAGLIFFLAPLLSVNDRYRLIDDITRIFAKDITFYEGEHCDDLYDEVMSYFPRSTMFAAFQKFFKTVPSAPIDQLSKVLFASKAQYGKIIKEDTNRYSFKIDLSDRGVCFPVTVQGDIIEDSDSFTVKINPMLSKYQIVYNQPENSITIEKSVLPDLVKQTQNIPPFILLYAMSLFLNKERINSDSIRKIGPSLVVFQSGTYYYYDKDRDDISYKPLSRTGFCLPTALHILQEIKRLKPEMTKDSMMGSTFTFPQSLVKMANWMNLLWKYNMFYGGDFFDENGKLISLTPSDICKILNKSLHFINRVEEHIKASEMFDYAKRGIEAYMTVYVTQRYASLLETSGKILDPLTINEKEWESEIKDWTDNGNSGEEIIDDDCMKELSSSKPLIDTWLFDLPSAFEQSKRFIKKIEKVHIISENEIFIKGMNTGVKELTLYILEKSDLYGVRGMNGKELQQTSAKKVYEFLTEREFIC